jgi:hypothetical protein
MVPSASVAMMLNGMLSRIVRRDRAELIDRSDRLRTMGHPAHRP